MALLPHHYQTGLGNIGVIMTHYVHLYANWTITSEFNSAVNDSPGKISRWMTHPKLMKNYFDYLSLMKIITKHYCVYIAVVTTNRLIHNRKQIISGREIFIPLIYG